MVDDERGQALTLEAVTAGLILLSAIGFALQMTAVTPLSASTSSQHLENQLGAEAEGVLASTAESGALTEAVRYWNSTGGRFHNASIESYYTSGPPPNAFGNELQRTFGDRNIAFNVIVTYQNRTQVGGEEILDEESQLMVRQGRPSDNAESASRTIVLDDEEKLINENFTSGPTINASNFYIPDSSPDSSDDQTVYNVVRIEVIVWRI